MRVWNDLKLNEQEQGQARLPTLALTKAIIYANDFYSWAKEKAEAEAVPGNKDLFSTVTLLMKEHSISENKALDMLREMTIECEKEHLAEVSKLEQTGPISENLSRWLDMTRLCHSGIMFWSAITDRYNRPAFAQSNGEVMKKGLLVENSANTGAPISGSNGVKEPNLDGTTDES